MNENENLNDSKLKVNRKNLKGGENLYGTDIPKNLPNSYTGGGFGIILDKIRKNKKLVLTLKIIALVLIFEILFLTFYLGTNKKIYKGVSVSGIDLGGLSRVEAQSLLESKLSKTTIDKDITLYFEEYEKKISLNDIICDLDYAKIAREAQRVGRDGSLKERIAQVVRAEAFDTEIELKYTIDLIKLRSVIYEIKYQLDRESKNASFKKEHGKDFVITNEVYGYELNVAKTIDKVREIIEENRQEETNNKIELIVNKSKPELIYDDFEASSCELSSFTTEYRRSDEERMAKLSESASKLDGQIVKANEEFSFNKVMGETITKESAEEGTDDNDEVNVQIATTLYNAVILAGLKVTDRTNCDALPDYIEIGRDALVYGKQVDFKFVNTTTNPIYIECYTFNGKLLVRIYGCENFKIYDSVTFSHSIYKVVPSTEVVEEYDPRVDEGDKITTQIGKSGCSAKVNVTYKVLGQKDKVVSLPDSEYLPTPTRISVGEVIKEDDKDNDKNKNDNDKNNEDANDKNVKSDGTITIGKE